MNSCPRPHGVMALIFEPSVTHLESTSCICSCLARRDRAQLQVPQHGACGRGAAHEARACLASMCCLCSPQSIFGRFAVYLRPFRASLKAVRCPVRHVLPCSALSSVHTFRLDASEQSLLVRHRPTGASKLPNTLCAVRPHCLLCRAVRGPLKVVLEACFGNRNKRWSQARRRRSVLGGPPPPLCPSLWARPPDGACILQAEAAYRTTASDMQARILPPVLHSQEAASDSTTVAADAGVGSAQKQRPAHSNLAVQTPPPEPKAAPWSDERASVPTTEAVRIGDILPFPGCTGKTACDVQQCACVPPTVLTKCRTVRLPLPNHPAGRRSASQ